IFILIHVDGVAHLRRSGVRIYTHLFRPARPRSPHDLKRCPLQSGRLQFRQHVTPPYVIAPKWLAVFGRKKPRVIACVTAPLDPRPEQFLRAQCKSGLPFGSITLGVSEFAFVEPPPNPYAVFRQIDIADPERQNLAWSHSLPSRQPCDQPFSDVKHLKHDEQTRRLEYPLFAT